MNSAAELVFGEDGALLRPFDVKCDREWQYLLGCAEMAKAHRKPGPSAYMDSGNQFFSEGKYVGARLSSSAYRSYQIT